MADSELLIVSLTGTIAFYFLMSYLFRRAEASPNGQTMKKALKPIIVIYIIAMTFQIVSLVDRLFF